MKENQKDSNQTIIMQQSASNAIGNKKDKN